MERQDQRKCETNVQAGTTPFHDSRLDYLRIFASLGVIVSHALDTGIRQVDPSSAAWMAMNAGILLGFTSNVLYVLLSGALLLPFKEESPWSFYRRRLTKVALPLAAYYWWYLFVNGHDFRTWEGWMSAGRMFLSGAPEEAPHLWLVYVLLSLYLAVPFLRYMMREMPAGDRMRMAAVILILAAVSTYFPVFGIHPGISVWLSSWGGVMLLGDCLYREEARRWDRLIIAAAAVSYVLSMALIRRREDYSSLVWNCVPTMIVLSCGVFSFFMRVRLFRQGGGCIRFFSKYSYSVLLIHWYVLYRVVLGRLHISVFTGNLFLGTVLTAGAAWAFSLATAWIYDHTAVKLLELLAGCAGRGIRWIAVASAGLRSHNRQP